MNKEKATFAMGCFWGVQTLFDNISGVVSTRVGYTGGVVQRPSYHEVCTDSTGHAEAIEVIFDSEKISYETLLSLFWKNHDSTTPNQQGPDFGSQYRSVIFYHDEEQMKKAINSRDEEQKRLTNKKIVTEIVSAKEFYPAEEYHQKYLEKKGLGSCHI